MEKEYWDILDKDGKFTGHRMKRERFNYFRAGQYHLVVHIWVRNSKGEYLIQKRSEDRQPMPGEWAATGGSVRSGEESRTAAIRELQEELGIRVLENEIHFSTRLTRKNSFVDIWFTTVDAELSSLVLQTEEVQDAKWVTEQELKDMIENHQFHNYGTVYFDTIFSK
jgi:8-oxo-dGTP pyrophosphatase MutT (NUDIX family)